MSIDRRVVEMGFENRQFESGVQTSLKSLDSLKKGLDLDASAKSLSNLATAGRSFSLAGIADGVQNISNHFTALGAIGFTVLQNITNAALDAGKKIIKAFTGIDDAMAGFSEYEAGINAFQTIVANTQSAGTTMDEVTVAMEEMNKYANQTIYSFGDMTKAMGLFTAQGVNLKDSMAGIKGIFNIISLTGGDAQKANSAIYQLSQAIASGTVKAQDWISVVNAGIGGTDFQNQLMQTARVHGVAVDAMIKKEGGFKNSLQTGWLSSAILLETLQQYTGDLSAAQLKQIGYSEEQIKQIQELGNRANDSATKLKSFTQVMDMLKSNTITSWAQSFKIVVGDLSEAYDLWSYIGNTVSGVLQTSSDARNVILTEWKDLGGRSLLINTLKDAFENLAAIVKPIKEAFTDIFPPMTGQRLYHLTITLHDLVANFKMGEGVAGKVKRIFEGVASVFDIVKMAVSSVIQVFGKLIGAIVPSGNSILDYLANVGDWILGIRNAVKANDTFVKALESAIKWVQGAVEWIKEGVKWVTQFADRIRQKFDEIKEHLMGFLDKATNPFKNVDMSGVTAFTDKIKERFGPLGKIIDIAGEGFGKFVGFVKNLDPLTKVLDFTGKVLGAMIGLVARGAPYFWKFAGIVGEALGQLGDAIVDGIKNLDFSKVFDAINGGLFGALLLAIRNFVNKGPGALEDISSPFKGASDILKGVTGILDGVKNSLQAWQENLKAKTLLTIAAAVAILAASLIALSMVDSKKLTTALIAVTTMFGELMATMAGVSKIAGGQGLMVVAASMVLISISLLVLAGALTKLAELDDKKLGQGLVAVGVLTTMLAIFSTVLSQQSTGLIKGAIGLLIFAGAIDLLTIAVTTLGNLDAVKLTNGLIGVGVVLTELAIFMKATNLDSMGIKKSVGLLILAGAVTVLAIAVEKFANIDPKSIQQGLVSVGVVLAELSAFVNMTGDGKKIISTSIGLAILGGAMLILAEAVNRMGSMSPETIGRGLMTMAGSLAIIIATMDLMPKDIALKAVGLTVIAASLVILAKALTDMGGMSWEEIAKGLTSLGGSLLILSIGLTLMQGTLAGSAALLIASAALLMLAPALKQLGSMKIQEIGLGLLALAGVFAVLGLAGLVLAPLIPTLLALAGTLVLFGVGIALVGAGVLAFSMALGALAVSGTAGAAALVLIVTSLLGLIPMIVTKIVEAILTFADLIAKGAPIIANALKEVLLSLIDVIAEVTPPLLIALGQLLLNLIALIVATVPAFVEAVVQLLETLLQTIAAHVPHIIQAGFDIIMGFLTGIRDNIWRVTRVAIDIILEFLDAIASKIPDIVDSAFKVIIAFINGLADGIDNNLPALQTAVGHLVDAILNGLKTGILGGIDMIGEAAKTLALTALDAMKKALGIKSPSKEFMKIGQYSVMGFVNGMGDFSNRVVKSASDLGESAVSTLTDTVSDIADILNGEMQASPTIRPVVDLSEVVAGGKQIDNILGGKTINVSAVASRTSAISSRIQGSDVVSVDQNGQSVEGAKISFTQINNSPKALSRIEIYRQTKNQLKTLKGLVNPA